MFVASDIPAFREQIFANASYLYNTSQDTGLSLTRSPRKFEVITYTVDDGKAYTASLLDISTGETILTGPPDANFAVAVHNLFDETCGRIARIFEEKEKAKNQDGKNGDKAMKQQA